jgi:segregation and condensation protein B
MSDAYVKNVVEAALLAAARPVSVAELVQIFDEQSRPTPKEMRALLEELAKDYDGRGVMVHETANGYRFQVRSDFSHEVSRLWPDRPQKYSRALLETLALIAYRQPITRAEIENVRGVAVNPNIIKTLMDRSWVRVVGHRDLPGHPELLGTTTEFLDYFGLKSIEDLPPLAELKAMTDLNLQLPLPVSADAAAAAASAPDANGETASAEGSTFTSALSDGGEVAMVPDESAAEEHASAARAEASAALADERDDDAEEEELNAAGSNAAGLVAAPPSEDD